MNNESQKIFSNIYDNYGFGSTESRSGPGSTLEETKNLRHKIQELIQQKKIKSVVDFPCGDLNWIKEILSSIESYTGCDIVEQCININKQNFPNQNFQCLDLASDPIPEADLLIVRDVIGHQPLEIGKQMINNILSSNCKYLLSTTWASKNGESWRKCNTGDVDRQNEGVDFGSFYPVNLMAEPFNLPEAELYFEENVFVDNFDKGNRKTLALWDLSKIKSKLNIKKELIEHKKTTIVTGIWNLARESAGAGFERPFNHYIENFKKLLKTDSPMVIFIDHEYEQIVWDIRSKNNTLLIHKNSESFKSFPFYDKVQEIRKNEKWLSQSGWLKESTQATLELYNPMVMSKMFMLNDARIYNPFNTDYFIWVDGGITNTVHEGYFTHDKVINKIDQFINKFLFISFPYPDGPEIHGFCRSKMETYCEEDPQYVCRGGIFGGHKDFIAEANSTYYNLLFDSLNSGYMGTEESVFTIMAHKEPSKYSRFELKSEDCGLLSSFFETLKNHIKSEAPNLSRPISKKCSLYVLTFNSPDQFSKLIESFKQVPDFFDMVEKYVLDNSTDPSVFEHNQKIANDNAFTLIKKNNIGICGGRQFIAEHFAETDSEYMLFFEDDMFLNPPSSTGFCKNGFRQYIQGLLPKSLKIMAKHKFDFLKLCFTEFFGDNRTQWSWYNVPQNVREKYWPEYHKLPEHGLDPNAPLLSFNNMGFEDGLTFLTGEIYYANWPQIVSKSGNKKMFLDTTWAHPYEQTWMSHIYQETKKGNIKPAILLASPITHDRFIHYDKSERVES